MQYNLAMDVSALLVEIDSELNRLQQARAALVALGAPAKRSPGRAKGALAKIVTKKRVMSAEAKARIGAAQKKRWAAAKKA